MRYKIFYRNTKYFYELTKRH